MGLHPRPETGCRLGAVVVAVGRKQEHGSVTIHLVGSIMGMAGGDEQMTVFGAMGKF